MGMDGKICLVTGATNGIGEVTAHALAKQGATVVIVGRNPEKSARVQREIQSVTGNQNVDVLIADLSLMSEVRKLASEFKDKYDQLHVLVNNAGAIFTDYKQTAEGHEMTFALNHLNYFLLTHLLLDTLKASGTADDKARIVNVSSEAHRPAKLNLSHLEMPRDKYNGLSAYNQSKLMNVMFTYELARRLEGMDATATVLHPGVVSTGFARNNGWLARMLVTLIKPFAKNAEQGAETMIYLATSPEVEGVNGKYFDNCKQKRTNEFSYNEAAQRQLWEHSEAVTGIKEMA